MSLPNMRQVVTGHNHEGKAIIDSDKELVPYNPLDGSPGKAGEMAFTTLWRTDSFPARAQGSWEDLNGQPIPLHDSIGTTARTVDFPPGPGLMHRTVSLDFAVVLYGEVTLELDDGVKTKMKQHDFAVQRGTIHSWVNESDQICRILFVLVPSEPIKVGDRELGETGVPSWGKN
ncbi:hypothetical protein FQN54_005343 [Arachnomyces sp. PD_36]|nr:hypothetical protein FQN54_005343 [Arachnomyces sp. PD_36]